VTDTPGHSSAKWSGRSDSAPATNISNSGQGETKRNRSDWERYGLAPIAVLTSSWKMSVKLAFLLLRCDTRSRWAACKRHGQMREGASHVADDLVGGCPRARKGRIIEIVRSTTDAGAELGNEFRVLHNPPRQNRTNLL
jgi:hypothetical protein